MKTIRLPAVAGQFYPSDPAELESMIEDMLRDVRPAQVGKTPRALISPHAGYIYSGRTAAHGFVSVANSSFDSIVIISPSHREYFDGISVFDGSAFRTPLGDLPIDETLRTELTSHETRIIKSRAGHGPEHAIEVQLPFIQKVFGNVKIVPITMGDQRSDLCYHLGERLGRVLSGKNTLLIASTDLSHYHPYDEANSMDADFIRHVEKFDYEKMMSDLETRRIEACGGGPTVSVMIAAKMLGSTATAILHHCNSGDVTGDRSAVVGYLSALIL